MWGHRKEPREPKTLKQIDRRLTRVEIRVRALETLRDQYAEAEKKRR